MSLVGSLEDLSLLDILQIVNVSRRTGTLQLRIPGLGEAFIYFSAGNVSDIVGAFDEEPFLRFFELQGLADGKDVEQARSRSGGDLRATLLRLAETGALNPKLVEQARRLELARRLKHLTQQDRGSFAFSLADSGEAPDETARLPFSPLTTAVSPQNLLTETFAENGLADWQAKKEAVRQAPPPPVPPAVDVGAAPSGTRPAGSPEEAENLFGPTPAPAPTPAVEAGPRPARAVEGRPSAAALAQPGKSRVAIVLASEESLFKSLLTRRLLRHVAEVHPVSDLAHYEAACRLLLSERKPFLALVDLLMSTSDGQGYLGGLEILEASAARHPQVKVILMSDVDDGSILEMAKAKGALVTVQKPSLSRLKVDQLDDSLEDFAAGLCSEIERLLPPVEEEVATFFRELGAESVSEGYRVRDQLSLLKGLMGELASPHESSEISLLVLRLASEYFERAILFLVKRDEIVGLGGFGETGDQEMMMLKVRRLRIPTGVGSVLDAAVAGRATAIRGAEGYSQVDRDFASALGTRVPKECVAIPMISRGRVVALLYADNALTGEPLPDLSGIEIFMAQAGLAMEKALLERQLLSLKKSIPGGTRES